MNLDELAGELGGSGPIWVELTKDGYTKTRVLLTDMLGTDVSISVDLEEIPGFFNQDIANEVVGSLFTAQKHIRNKQYKEAEEIIKKIKEKSPNIAAVYELEGGSLFVQSKRKESLDAYKQAFKINPKNVDTKRMIDLLEKNLGGKP